MTAEFLFMLVCVSLCVHVPVWADPSLFCVLVKKKKRIMSDKEGIETLSVQKFPGVSHHITAIHFVEYHDQSDAANYQLVM